MRLSARRAIWGTALLAALAVPACGGDDKSSASDHQTVATTAKSGYSTKITNPFVALTPVPLTVLKGRDEGKSTRSVNKLLKKTAVVDGVRVAVLDNEEFENGKRIEHTLDYFAQRSDGSVWYFGERVQNFENGKVNHEGQWVAGEGKNRPGLYMPAHPKVGDVFQQERAPGVAEDRTTVLTAGITKKTHAGTFKNCIHVKDYSPIDKLNEFKHYCPGIGLVHENEPHAFLDLVKYRKAKK
jgi:hypothetical protein